MHIKVTMFNLVIKDLSSMLEVVISILNFIVKQKKKNNASKISGTTLIAYQILPENYVFIQISIHRDHVIT
jgi:sorbitol-specific phosphotransferase system component IIC